MEIVFGFRNSSRAVWIKGLLFIDFEWIIIIVNVCALSSIVIIRTHYLLLTTNISSLRDGLYYNQTLICYKHLAPTEPLGRLIIFRSGCIENIDFLSVFSSSTIAIVNYTRPIFTDNNKHFVPTGRLLLSTLF